MFVVLAKKKVKRQCSSKRFMKKKAIVELPKRTTNARKQEGKKASGVTIFHLMGYVKVSSATLAQI